MEIYTGLVIDNNSLSHPGKVQVYIFGIDDTIPVAKKNISKILYISNDEKNGDMNINVVKELRKRCAWVPTLQSVAGGSNSVRTDMETGKVTTSTSAKTTEEFEWDKADWGAKAPGYRYSFFGAAKDAFCNPSQNFVRNANFAGYDYFPNNYINAPNGNFALPEVNSYVYIAFQGKNKSNPIIIGSAPRTRDWQLLFGLK